jgi:hypothetical protein
MSKRVLVSSLLGLTVVGGVVAGGLAVTAATAATKLTVENGSARYVAPSDATAGSLTFTADVSDDSGVKSFKVLAWPASSKLDPTEKELRGAEAAKCERTSDETSRCTYTLKVTQREAAELAKGTWHVSALATAKDGNTSFVPRAADFQITG